MPRVPAVLTDVLLLAMTLRKALEFRNETREGTWKKSEVFNTILHDQILYFIG